MSIVRCMKIVQPFLNKHINLSATARTKKTKSCEKEKDCCGNIIDDCVVPEVVVERECCPASFYTWKPKIPVLKSRPPVKKPKQKTNKRLAKQKCYAGMNTHIPEKPDVVECSKVCRKLPPICPSKEIKLVPPAPPNKLKCLPVADWDIDGDMD